MAYTSEIEKLERRWLENPKGRNFAPLADAYRKAGEVDRAIDLCKSGLERHPDYVSAHIVYGRCLIDQKNDAGAEEVFRKVLGLDPENVIALKVLGEISERQKRFDEAVSWLTKLLAADPMNGDAAEALARAKGKAAAAKPTVPLPVTSVSESPTAAMAKPDFVVEHTSIATPESTIEAARPSQDVETFDGSVNLDAAAHAAAKAEGLEVDEGVDLNAEPIPVEGLAATQFEAGEILPSVDLPLIMPDDVAPSPRRTPPPPPQPPSPPPPPSPRISGGVGRLPAAVVMSDDDGAADHTALSQAEPVVTETMAELYLKQGHQDEALRVYQALLAQRPHDARLRQKVDLLSRQGGGAARRPAASGISAQTFLRAILSGRGGGELTPAAPADSTLAGAFADAAADPEAASEPLPGAPTHPAGDTISLDAVFGDDAHPTSPDSGAEAAPAGEAPPTAEGRGFSFDEFFGGQTDAGGPPGAPAPGQPGGAAAARTSQRTSGRIQKPGEKPAESEGELDQFQSWLKRLKS